LIIKSIWEHVKRLFESMRLQGQFNILLDPMQEQIYGPCMPTQLTLQIEHSKRTVIHKN
jgi:hypothetical protein